MASQKPATRPGRKEYEARLSDLRAELVDMQVQLKKHSFPLLIVIGGEEASGKGDLVNNLNAWLDPRGVETFSFHRTTDEERERPQMWRYWRCLPARGRIGMYVGSWYTEAMRENPQSRRDFARFDRTAARIASFEQALAVDGALIVKCWLHLSRAGQARRLHTLADDPRTAWKIGEGDWEAHRDYERRSRLARRLRKATDVPGAGWVVIDGAEERSRNLAVVSLLLRSFRAHVKSVARRRPARPKPVSALKPAAVRQLRDMPLDRKLSADVYEAKRDKWLGRLNAAVRAAHVAGRSIVWVFEGWDAAGKGGAIRRLTDAIDARDCRVLSVGAPTDEEASRHYLWRFWCPLPRSGAATIYDRSWYGRVLVERVEGLARPEEWLRAYGEINDFEQQLVEHGIIVLKFWLQIGKDEQLRRFRSRENTLHKRHKMTSEDWRNRRKWAEYEVCVGDMLALTSSKPAPWHVIPANNKRYARLEILKLSCAEITAALRTAS